MLGERDALLLIVGDIREMQRRWLMWANQEYVALQPLVPCGVLIGFRLNRARRLLRQFLILIFGDQIYFDKDKPQPLTRFFVG